jgi:hypothetical protein
MKTLILLTLLFFTSTEIYSQTTEILTQEDAPITITEFQAEYQEDSRYTSEGIRYDVEYTNTSNNDIVAFSFGFFAFDVFNRSLGRPLNGFTIENLDVGDKNNGAWVQTTYSASLFRDYGTAISYVANVRFSDGSIWSYNEDNVLNQLQEFEESLTAEDLEAEN